MSNYIVKVVEHDFLEPRWSELETLIKWEFQDSNFINDGFTLERPLWHIKEGMNGNLGQGLKHVLALSVEKEKILAGAFCICIPLSDTASCDIGWFFSSSELSKIQRIKIVDRVFNQVHETVKKAGYKQIITEMGTQEGAKYLSKRQGYIHQPEGEITNRWIKKL